MPEPLHPALRLSAGTLSSEAECALAAMVQPFAVADVETMGLDADKDELLEPGAVLVDPSGTVTHELSLLVRPSRRVPDEIVRLTGVTQALLDTEGQPLADAVAEFLRHVGDRPVFCHNASFGTAFLHAAARQSRLRFNNPVYDALSLARLAWPELVSYRLALPAERAGGRLPTHRALTDARATLDVLLAARHLVRR